MRTMRVFMRMLDPMDAYEEDIAAQQHTSEEIDNKVERLYAMLQDDTDTDDKPASDMTVDEFSAQPCRMCGLNHPLDTCTDLDPADTTSDDPVRHVFDVDGRDMTDGWGQ